MGLVDFASGVQGGLRDLLAQRVAAQRYADQMKQQAFQNQRQIAGDKRAEQQMAQQAESVRMLREQQAAAAKDQATQRTYAEANSLGDQLPPQTFMAENDPAVSTMQQGGRGALLMPKDAGMGQDFQGPMPTGEMPQSVANNRPRGFLKTASAKQQKDMQDAADKQADNERQAQRDADTARYQASMAAIAGQNASASRQGRDAVQQMNELKLQEERDKIAAQKEKTATDAKNSADTTQTALGLIGQLRNHPGFNSAYGTVSSRFSDFNQAATDAGAIRDQLVAALTLPNLGKLKGSMSNQDVIFIKQMSTRLANPRISEAEATKALDEVEARLRGDGASGSGTSKPSAADLIKKYGGQ